MSKTKMRCNTCGKWFQSANAKEVTCPDCLQKARKEKQAAKNTPPTGKPAGTGTPAMSNPNQVRAAPPPKPKPAASGGSPNRWFDTLNDIKVGQPDQPTRPKIPSVPAPRPNRGGSEEGPPRERESSGPGNYRDRDGQQGNYREREGQPGNHRDRDEQAGRGPGGGGYRGPGNYRENERERDYRGPAAYRVGGLSGTLGQRPRQPSEGGYHRGPRPGPGGRPGGPGGAATGEKPFKPKKPKSATPKPPTPSKPKKEKQPPPAPFVPTAEQIAQVEERYRELAVPSEYDGIRTQISKELNIPKKAVKKIIKDLRDREEIPSWWDLQTYKGPSEELEKIRELYVPHLPLPSIGVHRQIAEQLDLKPVTVYQAIKVIRQEMNLPQYNDPALHGIELKPRGKKAQTEEAEAQEGEPAASAATATETEAETTAQAAETTEATETPSTEAPNSPAEQEAVATATDQTTTEPVSAETQATTEPLAQQDETAETVTATVDGSANHEQQ
jgi:hypothetical protein